MSGAREAATWLGEIAGRLASPTPALEAEAARMRDAARSAIADRRAPDGTPWPAPKPSSSGRPRSSSRRSGRLASSGRALVERGVAIVEFNAPYAGFLQDGTDDMAPRRFLPFAGDKATDGGSLAGIEDRIGTWIVRGSK